MHNLCQVEMMQHMNCGEGVNCKVQIILHNTPNSGYMDHVYPAKMVHISEKSIRNRTTNLQDFPTQHGQTGGGEGILHGLPLHLRALPHRHPNDGRRLLQRLCQAKISWAWHTITLRHKDRFWGLLNCFLSHKMALASYQVWVKYKFYMHAL